MNKLELKNIAVSNNGKKVVQDISLTINGGETHILMGPNGSGKSSLVNGIFGHPKYEISGGQILLGSKDITTSTTDKKAKKGLFLSMQYLPEIPGVSMGQFLYRAYKEINGGDESVLEFHKKISDKAADLGIDKSFLSRHVNSGLSGGEKKQSEVLQMAVLNPKFAILDEIDSGVDVDSLGKIFNAITKLSKDGTGFLLITHYPGILKKITPDYVHIMKEGKIVKSGGREIINEIEANGFGE
ncbi:MAG: Fe-S cluster assembly ATPase SufC [Candidatus Paceibacterota bacterium]|jgi:Fe-S cluster assembly ATP-binding protein